LVVVDGPGVATAAREATQVRRAGAGRPRLVLDAPADGGARLAVEVHRVEGVTRLLADQVEADVRADHRLAAGIDGGRGDHGGRGGSRVRGHGGDGRRAVESLPHARAIMDAASEEEPARLGPVLPEAAVQVLEGDV